MQINKEKVSNLFTEMTGKQIITGYEHFSDDFKISLFKIIQLFLLFEKIFFVKFSKDTVRGVRTFNGLYEELKKILKKSRI